MPVVNCLHQQRPVRLTQMIKAGERPVADLPFAFVMADQPAVDLIFHRQPGQFIRGDRVNKVLEAALQDNRALLPVTLQEIRPVEVKLVIHCVFHCSGETSSEYNGCRARRVYFPAQKPSGGYLFPSLTLAAKGYLHPRAAERAVAEGNAALITHDDLTRHRQPDALAGA